MSAAFLDSAFLIGLNHFVVRLSQGNCLLVELVYANSKQNFILNSL